MKSDRFRLPSRGLSLRGRGPLGHLEAAGWLAPGVLWVEGWLTCPPTASLSLKVRARGVERQVEAQRFCFSRSDIEQIPGAHGEIFVLSDSEWTADTKTVEAIFVPHADGWYRWTRRRGITVAPDLLQLLPARIPYLPEESLQRFRTFLEEFSSQAVGLDRVDPTYRRNMATMDELLPAEETPEHVPAADEAPEHEAPVWVPSFESSSVYFDYVVVVDSEHIFLRGWLLDVEQVVADVEMISLGGGRIGLRDHLYRVRRPDVTEALRPKHGESAEGKLGFVGLVRIGREALERPGSRFGLRLVDGAWLPVGTPQWTVDPLAARSELLNCWPEELFLELRLVESCFAPALQRLQRRCRDQAVTARMLEFGSSPAAPEISIVIPLHRRLDLVEHQLARLADESSLAETEIIYVLDEKELEPQVERSWFHLCQLYQVPIRLAVLSQDYGYAAAVNVGVKHARGRLLVLMHSDVFAGRPGWLRVMADLYSTRREIGALGVKLLYEDRSLQHAGIFFSRRLRPDGLWSNVHPYKGLPRRHPAVAGSRRVPAVSGACLMIERDLFERVGGLSDQFIAGDLEDADLCLRLLEEKRQCWYLGDAELFHLEGVVRQRGLGWQRNLWTELYNHWLQTHLWSSRIEEVMAEFGDP